MPTTVQEFVARTTRKAADDLLAAALSLTEDQRYFSPRNMGRTVADQLAECAMMNSYSADLIATKRWTAPDWPQWTEQKVELSKDWEPLQGAFRESIEKLVDAIRAVPDDDLDSDVLLPWETAEMSKVIYYCAWNMTYHEGQINYIASLIE